ncbi:MULTISPECIES: hypothetical protein [unclassified Streptomyces]|uniref:hypothetical protein n=1 Tax=unclassified Streptomyces TaxID=2593676 RepID=UPI001EFE1D8A|nr:hypothetical protein [Streptomyces sp. BvitLS-983]
MATTMFRHGAGPTIGSSQAVATSWVSQARTTSSAPAAAAMFASSAIPASASWPDLSGRAQISPTSSPRTSGIISGRGTAPSPSDAVYVSFATPTSPFHIRVSTEAPVSRLFVITSDPATWSDAVSGR